jgi:prevent-host-death family protein
MVAGVKELKDNLSHYLRRVAKGERVAVTAHGRVVAELVPPRLEGTGHTRYEQRVAEGAIRPAMRERSDAEFWAEWRALVDRGPKLPKGTAQELIDVDRRDFWERDDS